MFPDADDGPTQLPKCGVVLTIPLDVATQFRLPEVPIGGGNGRVLGALMPEAPIDEYGDALARERDVRSGCGSSRPDLVVHAVAQSCAVEQ